MTGQPSEGKAIFAQALEIEDLAARDAFVRQACGDRVELRAEVEDLLRAFQQAGSFLEEPALAAEMTAPFSPSAEAPGCVVGRYKLLQQIGEGGFGVVFMAEQVEPVRRKVALKIIKPGMDSREVIARFEAERQALALMDHPNIAKVFDAGATASGRPYFVMELIRGIPITSYCDRNHLGPRERLELFVSVCQAVQHAHQKGIIHRDMKPSNFLITLHDGTPVVKVIDFGVAKAIDRRLTERTLFTRYEQMVGTPLYMSPEQAEMSGLDVDTRTDIYSLGVLLYELLTGSTPFDRERLRSAAFDEIRRIIREEEPLRPSIQVTTLKSAADVSQHRTMEPKRLSLLLRGDLDWIVMKALEKDRTRRYATAKDLADDVVHYLTDQPVEARAPSASYRLRKFVRRYRLPVVASAIVLIALVFGILCISFALYQTIQRERIAAQAAIDLEQQADRDGRKLAYQAWNERNRVQLRRLLNCLLPRPGDDRPPDFPLRYLLARYKELCDPANVFELSTPADVTSVGYSADGRYLGIGCVNATVLLYNVHEKGYRWNDLVLGCPDGKVTQGTKGSSPRRRAQHGILPPGCKTPGHRRRIGRSVTLGYKFLGACACPRSSRKGRVDLFLFHRPVGDCRRHVPRFGVGRLWRDFDLGPEGD